MARFSDNGRPGVWRLALSWTLLVAFALQAYATQTHIHPSSIAQAAGSPIASRPSGDHEAIACPFCQAIAAAGAFVGPTPVAISFPDLRAEAAVLPRFAIGLGIHTASFNWRSRAPPQH